MLGTSPSMTKEELADLLEHDAEKSEWFSGDIML
jgi:hypothetical protein